jgi:hypothetical protein
LFGPDALGQVGWGVAGWGLGTWGWGLGGRWWCSVAGPDEHFAVFVDSYFFGINELFFEVFQRLVIERELSLQYPIG